MDQADLLAAADDFHRCIEERHVDVDGDVAAVLQRVSMHATVLGEDRCVTVFICELGRGQPEGGRLVKGNAPPLRAGGLPGA
jgi:hypothetical protein